MDSTVIVAIISFAGTFVGTAGGIIASGKLTEYRLKELEKKVENHTIATSKIPILEEKIKGFSVRIKKLEGESALKQGYFDAYN